MAKFINIDEAVKLLNDGDTLGVSGSGGAGSPEGLLISLGRRYCKENHPKSISVACGICTGNLTKDLVGFNNLAYRGLVKKCISSHMGRALLFSEAIYNNQFEAYLIPLGVYAELLRAISSGKSNVITEVGLHTFCDPRVEGCKANEKSKSKIVDLVKINGKTHLLYKNFPINVAFIKATYADRDGNITLYNEPVIGEQFLLASATKQSGGKVICEVEKILPKGAIKAKYVDIFNKLVDYIVVSKPNKSLPNYNFPIYRPELIGEKKIKLKDIKTLPLNERKVCGRRACLELKKGDIVNLGIGMPDSVGLISSEEGFNHDITITMETGVFGGVPVFGDSFGASINPISIIPSNNMLNLYDGGLLDKAILGLGEMDKEGNVNVSKLNGRITGPGGFINITQNTKKVIFIGTFTATGLEEEIKEGKLIIKKEGKYKKLKKRVSQITFSSKYALKKNIDVIYITERAVFKLTNKGVELIEIAPGISLKNDILKNMEFMPIIPKKIKKMNKKIFMSEKMGIKI